MIPNKLQTFNSLCCWVYIVGYGGGMLHSDKLKIECTLEADAVVAMTTQATTKVYKVPNRFISEGCSQISKFRVGNGALLALIPHAVTCFQDSIFRFRTLI
mmetsp:Transcript_3963/g.5434  ORF Transcript_3963/g.5434 Transcript_3963/m.5434 type:complete len:101 (-) Transcript_3963:162-464(-)